MKKSKMFTLKWIKKLDLSNMLDILSFDMVFDGTIENQFNVKYFEDIENYSCVRHQIMADIYGWGINSR